ncbi:hypothetical protein BV898_06182 [Hypsibius exemplaris]|uniref:WD repeat-containing protein 54 beta-propeller domain-containing protein n=1 Tax=Hypsibius exemplaris TaxID=2072580 RepID=A0A1W0WXI2_HYPEX|nr:hypothetical protein BV898_06182 [Hypsibius exemplaris]
MVLTEFFICLGYGNGTMRLLCRDTGSVYCDVYAHAAALTAMAYNSSSQVLLSVGEDGLIRAWAIDEKQEECKIKYLQHEVVDDLMLCGVQFLNEGGTIFGVVGYDRNEIITYKA